MTSDRILMNPRPSGKTKVKGKKADNSIIDMLTFDPDSPVANANGNQLASVQNVQDAGGGASYYCNGSSQYIALPVAPTQMNYGNSSFTSILSFVPTNSNADQIIRAKIDNSSQGFFLQYKAVGCVRAYSQFLGNQSLVQTPNGSVPTGKITTVAFQRITTPGVANETVSLYLNGSLAVTGTQVPVNTYPTSTINSIDYPGTSLGNQYYRLLEFNYALSSDKIQRYSAGGKLDYEDIGGSTALVNTSTVLNANGYTGHTYSTFTGASATGFTASDSAIEAGIRVIFPMTLVQGKRYLITFDYTAVNTTFVLNGGTVGYTGTGDNAPAVAGTPYSGILSVVASGTTALMFIADTTSTTNSLVISNLKVTQIGATVALEPECILKQNVNNVDSSLWLDSSGNGLNGTANNGALPINTPKEMQTRDYSRAFSATTLGWYDITPTPAPVPLQAGATYLVRTRLTFPITGMTSNYLSLLTSTTGDNSSNILGDQVGTPVLGATTGGGAGMDRVDVITTTAPINVYAKIYLTTTTTATMSVRIQAIRIA
jgi:hypothetical protein